ncbi:MAG: glycosyltransferase [Oscillospiraceae bacterium]|nr:glycosyltransferase [Oscillospiraceae bacterium]
MLSRIKRFFTRKNGQVLDEIRNTQEDIKAGYKKLEKLMCALDNKITSADKKFGSDIKSLGARIDKRFEFTHNAMEQRNISLRDKLIWLEKKIESLDRKTTRRFNNIDYFKKYDYYKNLNPGEYSLALKEWYKKRTEQELDLSNPQTYNEKMQWLKLYDGDPLKSKLADKYEVREWVKDKIGERYLIGLLGVWENYDDMNFDALPESFVLKCTHGCAWNLIVKEKGTIDHTDAKSKFDQWMNTNYAFFSLELHYNDIRPKIIAEEYLENADGGIYDYKIWCFDGKAEYIQFLSDRNTGLKMAFFDLEWNLLPFVYDYPRNEEPVSKPDNLDEMLRLAQTLAQGFCHVRVDFYRLNDGTLKFGEMTFSSAAGAAKWNPREYDLLLGQKITLPENKSVRNCEGEIQS